MIARYSVRPETPVLFPVCDGYDGPAERLKMICAQISEPALVEADTVIVPVKLSVKRSSYCKQPMLTSSSARSNRFTANARTFLCVKLGPKSSRASSIPTSCPHNGSSFSTACFASTGSDQVMHLRNLVRDRGERKREKRNFHSRSLSTVESDAVGGKRNISCVLLVRRLY